MSLRRTLGPLALTIVGLSACKAPKYQLLPLEAAAYQAPKPLVEVVTAPVEPPPPVPTGPIRVAGANWQATALEYPLPASFVRPVATFDGVMFQSLVWDRQPFDRLLVASPVTPGSWVELLPLH